MIKVMFVCYGNICRSPMAEFVFRDLVKKNGLDDKFVIKSSATSTEEIGHAVYPPARRELAKHNISCEGKVAVQLLASDYNDYDYFIGMDSYNIRAMERLFNGDKDNKVYKLLSFAGLDSDIADPWYTDRFDVTYNDVILGCTKFLEYVLKLDK